MVPPFAAGTTICLVCVSVPPPHDAEHALHAPQVVTTQSMRVGVGVGVGVGRVVDA